MTSESHELARTDATPGEDQELARLRQALELLAEDAHPTESCPPPETIWAGIQGELPSVAMRALVDHVGTCMACAEAFEIAEEVNRNRLAVETSEPSVPAVPGSRRFQWLRWVAALILLVVGAQRLPWQEWIEGPGHRGSNGGEIRSLIPGAEPLSRQSCLLRWAGPERGLTYNLRVVAWINGDRTSIVEMEDLEVTEFLVPSELLDGLSTGTKLTWWVEALRAGQPIAAKTFTSRIR